MNKTFCALPFTSFTCTIGNGVRPCCRWDEKRMTEEDRKFLHFNFPMKKLSDNPYETLNGTSFNRLREKMLKGEYISGCHKCYFDEESKGWSMRKHYNELFEDYANPFSENKFEKLRYFEIAIDNLCNLECRMCDSEASSKLQKRDKYLGKPVYKKFMPDVSFLRDMDLTELTHVKLLGGEPFLTPNLEAILQILPKHITIEFATNGTTIPKRHIIDMLNEFKTVYLFISMDATHKINNYQRMHGDYVQAINTGIELENLIPNSKICFYSTISLYNANYIAKTKQDVENLGFQHGFGFVYNSPTSIEFAPDWYRDWLIDEVKGSMFESVFKDFYKNKSYSHNEWHRFLHETNLLDKFYRVRLKDYNPGLNEMINTHKKKYIDSHEKPVTRECKLCDAL